MLGIIFISLLQDSHSPVSADINGRNYFHATIVNIHYPQCRSFAEKFVTDFAEILMFSVPQKLDMF